MILSNSWEDLSRRSAKKDTRDIGNDQQGEADGEDQGVKVEARSKPSQPDPGKLDQPDPGKLEQADPGELEQPGKSKLWEEDTATTIIQVKGSVAHPFQPRLVEEEGTGRSVLVDPINQV